MQNEELLAKRNFIIAYFNNFITKIRRVEQINALGMVEEAITLTCCYIDALGNLRYEEQTHKNFIKFLLNYSDHMDTLSKINISYLLNKGNPKWGTERVGKLTEYGKIAPVLEDKFKLSNISNEVPKVILIEILSQELRKLDKENLNKNLDDFTYAEFLYNNYRGPGVHFGGITEARSASFLQSDLSMEPVFSSNEWMYFKPDSIIGFLKSGHANLAKECEEEIKWPHELDQP